MDHAEIDNFTKSTVDIHVHVAKGGILFHCQSVCQFVPQSICINGISLNFIM